MRLAIRAYERGYITLGELMILNYLDDAVQELHYDN